MDKPSENVIGFLEKLQDAQNELGKLWTWYCHQGAQPKRPVLTLCRSQPDGASKRNGVLYLTLPVKGTDKRDYDLSVELSWNSSGWAIATEIWMDTENGQDLVRELPSRTASDLQACREQAHAAVRDLAKFADVVLDAGAPPTAGPIGHTGPGQLKSSKKAPR